MQIKFFLHKTEQYETETNIPICMYVQYQHRNVHMRLNHAMDQQTYKTNEWTEQGYMRQKINECTERTKPIGCQ